MLMSLVESAAYLFTNQSDNEAFISYILIPATAFNYIYK